MASQRSAKRAVLDEVPALEPEVAQLPPILPLPIREQIQTPVQKKYFNLQLFTRVADEYDLATRAMSLGQDARWKHRLLELLPMMARPRCVDLACGTGDLTLGVARALSRRRHPRRRPDRSRCWMSRADGSCLLH